MLFVLYCLVNFQVELRFQTCQIDRADIQADLTQPLFTCSNRIMETLEPCVKYVQS